MVTRDEGEDWDEKEKEWRSRNESSVVMSEVLEWC